MDRERNFAKKHKINKKFLGKNKPIKLYKENRNKIDLYKKEVEDLTSKYQDESILINTYSDFPLTNRTKQALIKCNYFVPTEIQKESIMFALKGHDILGAAKTGSGKTLAFVIPVLERLYCLGWSSIDGLGVIIITPTRELAYQIFEVINKVGSNHRFSVALVIGGKDLAKERKVLDKCNILICTPGRLLQHMDENPLFDAMNLKILILDEADRILDLGFEKTLNAILDNLPEERQTILFSATQTKSVKDLARLSLKNPVYVSVHEHAKHTTPENLQQNYVVCEAHDKINMIWSFIKSHKKQKVLVFMASCKQVKFIFESFCRLRPGVSIMALYGSLHQLRRMQIYDEFCKKNHVVMFATDVASRGLDFPNVNWVVQLDCPEDVNTYIHRVGRTARYEKGGEALLVLLPSEENSMVEQLKNGKVPVEKIKVNPTKLQTIQRKLDTILARDVTLMDSGARAFKAYLKNIFLMKDKSVFDVTTIDTNSYANSLGLSFVPRIRFLEKRLQGFTHPSTSSERKPEKQSEGKQLLGFDDGSDSDDDMLRSKRTYIPDPEVVEEVEVCRSKKPLTKFALARRALKKKVQLNVKTKFDQDGEEVREICGTIVPVVGADIEKEMLEEGYSIEKAKLLKEKEDEVDKVLFKEKIKTRHREKRLKIKKERLGDSVTGPATLLEDADGSEASDIDPNQISDSEDEGSSLEVKSEGDDSDQNESDVNENVDISKQSDNDDISDQSDDEDISITDSKIKKRKKPMEDLIAKKSKLSKENNQSKKNTHRTLEDDEQLALHLLSGI